MSHNNQTNKYYYHGAPTIEIAKQIMNEGLYMQYNDINRTAKPELNPVGLLTYSYGHENVGKNAVVIIDQPNGYNVVQYNDTGKKIVGTGQGIKTINEFDTNYVIPTKYIVGYVDKYNDKVIYNPNYYKFQEKQELSQTVDSMVEAMAQGVDVLGEHNNEMQASNTRIMGYAKMWILELITAIIIIGIIVLGIVLNY